jgi:ubiquinone/menaquinone biosynthesis C-methylase UbiE
MAPEQRTARSVFDPAASDYDAARPSYPEALLDELEAVSGPLDGQLVLDWGAGTGISSRQLAGRGAHVTLLDIGEQMLRYARAHDPLSYCVLGHGSHMPVRSGCADLTTFAQSFHWFEQPVVLAEIARVLRSGGYWAAWWNRPRPDGPGWFERYQDVLVASCPGYTWRHLRDEAMAPDWNGGPMTSARAAVVPWTRQVTAAQWIMDERSKSYMISLEPAVRQAVLARLSGIVADEFPDGQMVVPYATTLLAARKAG